MTDNTLRLFTKVYTYYFVYRDRDEGIVDTYCMDSNLPPSILYDLFLATALFARQTSGNTYSRMYATLKEYQTKEQGTLPTPQRLMSRIINTN